MDRKEFSMLSISQPLTGSACGNYYTGGGAEGYYTNPLESAGEWFGGAAEKLRLKGEVDPRTFQRLLSGFSTNGRQALVQNAGSPDRQCGWDLTFSAPKSVSVLWALAPDATRLVLEDCHRESVRASLSVLEERAGITRRGKGGAIKERAALLFALFTHGTSRALDPQLHTHAVLVNLAVRRDGTTGTIQSRDIFRAKMEAGGFYRTDLATRLEQRLGLQIEHERWSFHVRGVPKELCAAFSSRRKAITKALAEQGREGAIAAKVAALETRSKKLRISPEKLFARWQARALAHGWGREQAQATIRIRERKEHFQARRTKSFAGRKQHKAEHSTRREKQSRAQSTHQAKPEHFWNDFGNRAENNRSGTRDRERSRFVRIEWRTLFPHAPSWSPVRDWRLPVVAMQKPHYQRWGFIELRKTLGIANLKLGEFRIQQRRIAPRAPRWSPLHGKSIPACRVSIKVGKSVRTKLEWIGFD